MSGNLKLLKTVFLCWWIQKMAENRQFKNLETTKTLSME